MGDAPIRVAVNLAVTLGLSSLLLAALPTPAHATVMWIFSGSLDDFTDNPLPAGTPFRLSLEIDELSSPTVSNGNLTARYVDSPVIGYTIDLGDGAIARSQTLPEAQFNSIVLAFDDPNAGPFTDTQEAQVLVVVNQPELSLSLSVALFADTPILDPVPLPSQQDDLPPFDQWNVEIFGAPLVQVRHEPLDEAEHVEFSGRIEAWSIVPEPSTGTLLSLGFAALARRRSQGPASVRR